jgi:hypothetical protein
MGRTTLLILASRLYHPVALARILIQHSKCFHLLYITKMVLGLTLAMGAELILPSLGEDEEALLPVHMLGAIVPVQRVVVTALRAASPMAMAMSTATATVVLSPALVALGRNPWRVPISASTTSSRVAAESERSLTAR